MPEDMPDRMPEDMPDRMPEDLPITKCINVMVGITRSKVILFFWYLCKFGASTVFLLGACAGLVTLTAQNIDRHQKKTTTTQKWTHSSYPDPVNALP